MLNRANREPVVPVVVVLRIDTTRVEVQVPSIDSRVERCRPVVAVRAAIVPRRTGSVARAREKQRPLKVGRRLLTLASENRHCHGWQRCGVPTCRYLCFSTLSHRLCADGQPLNLWVLGNNPKYVKERTRLRSGRTKVCMIFTADATISVSTG